MRGPAISGESDSESLQTTGICTRRAGKLCKAHSRMYRSQFLQPNIRWKAQAEIDTVHSVLQFSNLKTFVENFLFFQNLRNCTETVTEFLPDF